MGSGKLVLDKQKEGKDIIPVELRGKVYILLTRTVLRRRSGSRCVLYLRWDGKRWVVDVYWLDVYFYRYVRFVRSREVALGHLNPGLFWVWSPALRATPHLVRQRRMGMWGFFFAKFLINCFQIGNYVHGLRLQVTASSIIKKSEYRRLRFSVEYF